MKKKNKAQEKDFTLSIKDVIDRLNISRQTLWVYRKTGKILAKRIGGRVLISKSSVNRLIEDAPYCHEEGY